MSRTERVIAGYLTSLLQMVVSAGLNFILAPIIVRAAGPAALGAYATLNQILLLLSLTDAGFGTATNRFLAIAYRGECSGRFSQVLATSRTVFGVTNLLYASFAVLLAFKAGVLLRLPLDLQPDIRLAFFAIAVWAVLRSPWCIYAPALVAAQNMSRSNLIALVGNLIRLAVSLLLVQLGAGLFGLMLAAILGEAIILILSRWQARRHLTGLNLQWGFPDRLLMREMGTFGLHALVWNAALYVAGYSDNVLLSALFGPVVVSVYYATVAPAQWLWLGILRLNQTSVPGVCQLFGAGDGAALRAVFLRLIRYSVALAAVEASMIAVLNRPFITIWLGQQRFAGNLANGLLCVQIFVAVCANVHYSFLVTLGETKALSLATVGDAIGKLCLGLTLGRHFGISGLLGGSVLSSILCTAWTWPVVWRRIGPDVTGQITREAARLVSLWIQVTSLGYLLLLLLDRRPTTVRLAATGVFLLAGWAVLLWHKVVVPEHRVALRKWASSWNWRVALPASGVR